MRYNAGAPNIQDYLDYFRARKILPVTILQTHSFENVLVQIDIMIVRQDIKEKFLGPNKVLRPFVS